jgi:hypothetical protein
VAAALHGAERDCIDHQPRLEARLDLKETADLAEHCDSLMVERASRGFEPGIC